MKDHRIQQQLEDGLSSLCFTEQQHRDMLNRIINGGKVKVKKKISVGFVLAIILLLATVTGALAATDVWEKLWEVWQESFNRMNTTGSFDAVESFDQQAFEKEYGGAKDDLIVSTVPQAGDLDYETAYAIARQAILDAFGTPEAELDAMGIYPQFYTTPYHDEVNEWEFYFTPRQNVNIDEDHSYDAPGEYMIRVASPSGEVTECFWYIDDFWPEYALRTWNAGKHDYVYEKAVDDGVFHTMPRDQQENFLTLFAEAGYDAEPVKKNLETLLNGSLWRIVTWADAEENLLNSDSPSIQAVLEAMKKEYGFSKAQMEKYDFNLLPSPVDSETEDYFLAYNYNLCYPRFQSGVMGEFELSINQYPERLGFWLIRLDPAAHTVIEVEHVNKTMDETGFLPSDKLLGRAHWSVNDLKEYETLRQQAIQIDRDTKTGLLSENLARGKFDTLMRAYGANPASYPRQEDGTEGMRKADAFEITRKAVMEKYHLTSRQMVEMYPRYTDSYIVGSRWEIHLYPAETDNTNTNYPELTVSISVQDNRVVIQELNDAAETAKEEN